jgi:hypothetical protein
MSLENRLKSVYAIPDDAVVDRVVADGIVNCTVKGKFGDSVNPGHDAPNT